MKRPHISRFLQIGVIGFFTALLGFVIAVVADIYNFLWLGKIGFVITAFAVVASGAIIFCGIIFHAYEAVVGGLKSMKSLETQGFVATIDHAKKHHQDSSKK
jgi:hypothetical protein